jgi:glutathione peroxidase
MEAHMTAYDFSFPGLTGGVIALQAFAGKAILVVNTASRCGMTPQYRSLQALWNRERGRGLVVLGVPSNDFGEQEPAADAEIAQFCARNYGVEFPMAAKQRVIGPSAHPFYRWIIEELGDAAAPRWNFHKYLIDRTGALAGTFGSRQEPLSAEITIAIDAVLKG